MNEDLRTLNSHSIKSSSKVLCVASKSNDPSKPNETSLKAGRQISEAILNAAVSTMKGSLASAIRNFISQSSEGMENRHKERLTLTELVMKQIDTLDLVEIGRDDTRLRTRRKEAICYAQQLLDELDTAFTSHQD